MKARCIAQSVRSAVGYSHIPPDPDPDPLGSPSLPRPSINPKSLRLDVSGVPPPSFESTPPCPNSSEGPLALSGRPLSGDLSRLLDSQIPDSTTPELHHPHLRVPSHGRRRPFFVSRPSGPCGGSGRLATTRRGGPTPRREPRGGVCPRGDSPSLDTPDWTHQSRGRVGLFWRVTSGRGVLTLLGRVGESVQDPLVGLWRRGGEEGDRKT